MGDVLRYRIPNASAVVSTGVFKKVHSILDASGFFVSDFEKENVFVFEEKDLSESFSYSKDSIEEQTKDDYLIAAAEFLSNIQREKLNKAIFSRVKMVQQKVNEIELFNALCEKYESAFVYLISSELFGTWIGATPEVLIQRKGTSAHTMSLAGTLPSNSPMGWSSKELEEQGFVTEFIHSQLIERNVQELVQSELKTVVAGPVKHLRTDFNFNLSEKNVLELVASLHPTPAVSGLPRREAIQLINRLEKHKRNFYTGIIGVQNAQDSNIFVNLRCAQVFESNIALYLGGGFTQDSNILKEWEETEVKAATLLEVIEKLQNYYDINR